MSAIEDAAKLIREVETIAVLTGAGVSKESGVPTFRDAMEGLWAKYNPEELATPQAFKANPKLVWDWYAWRREMVAKAKPNPGHFALAQLQDLKTVHLITQNVDDLHEQAGSKDVIHLHGNIARSKCYDNCQGNPTIIDLSSLNYDKDDTPPHCPHCNAYLRPDVVWFHENLPAYELNRAIELSQICDVMIVVGTSGLVSPASEMPRIAKQAHAKVIEANPEYSMISRYADVRLEGGSGLMLPQLLEALKND
jgi:NAD-dependent deacetylase